MLKTNPESGPQFQYYSIKTDPSVFGGFKDLVKAYQDKSAELCLFDSEFEIPSWEDFTIRDFEGWYPYMARSNAAATRDDVVFRYFGTSLVQLHGADFTGKSFEQIARPEMLALVKKHWKHFFTEPKISIGKTKAIIGHNITMVLDILHLPLSDRCGHFSHVIHFAHKSDLPF